MKRPQGKCIFCGGFGLSKEHILADWMRELLPSGTAGSHHELRASRINLDTGQIEHGAAQKGRLANVGDHRSRKLRVVCVDCNTGWMSALQKKTKPILTPFIIGGWLRLNVVQQRTLAAWAAMFTMVFESGHPPTVAASQEDRSHLMATEKAPKGWRIWIGAYAGARYNMGLLHRSALLAGDNAPVTNERLVDTQSTVFCVRSIVFLTFSSSFPKPSEKMMSILRQTASVFHLKRIGPTSLTWPSSRPKYLMDDLVSSLSDATSYAMRFGAA